MNTYIDPTVSIHAPVKVRPLDYYSIAVKTLFQFTHL